MFFQNFKVLIRISHLGNEWKKSIFFSSQSAVNCKTMAHLQKKVFRYSCVYYHLSYNTIPSRSYNLFIFIPYICFACFSFGHRVFSFSQALQLCATDPTLYYRWISQFLDVNGSDVGRNFSFAEVIATKLTLGNIKKKSYLSSFSKSWLAVDLILLVL